MNDPIVALFAVADAWCAHTGFSEATLSTRLLNDGKRMSRLRQGADIGVRTLGRAMFWLSTNWPVDLPWPKGIPRPETAAAVKEGA